jgi:hypothetical protein
MYRCVYTAAADLNFRFFIQENNGDRMLTFDTITYIRNICRPLPPHPPPNLVYVRQGKAQNKFIETQNI